jgi:hypothetical protein
MPILSLDSNAAVEILLYTNLIHGCCIYLSTHQPFHGYHDLNFPAISIHIKQDLEAQGYGHATSHTREKAIEEIIDSPASPHSCTQNTTVEDFPLHNKALQQWTL